MKKHIILAVLLLTLAFTGCANSDAHPAANQEESAGLRISSFESKLELSPNADNGSDGQKNSREDDYISGTGTAVDNNGGNYVQYGDVIYYREYDSESFEETGLWDAFHPTRGATSKMMRLNLDGTTDVLFEDDGFGPIFIFQDDPRGAQFILTRFTENWDKETYAVALRDHTTSMHMPGEVFAVDEERALIIGILGRGELFAADLYTWEKTISTEDYRQPIYYDPEDGVLYCSTPSWSDEVSITTFSSIRVTDGVEIILLSETNDTIGKTIIGTEYAQWIEFQDIQTDGDFVYANVAEYSGNQYLFGDWVRLRFRKDGSAFEHVHQPSEKDWFGAYRPFTYLSDGPFYRDVPGYYMFYDIPDTQAVQLITPDDLAKLGLPDGTYFGEDDFASLKNIEYVDELVFFTVMTGTRNYDADVGWRIGYDRGVSTLYKKDLTTGEISEVYSY